jgi:hypothetical protein
MTPPNPPFITFNSILERGRKVLAWQRLFFAIFFAIFLRPTEQICPGSAGPFIVSILLALLFSLFHENGSGATTCTIAGYAPR